MTDPTLFAPDTAPADTSSAHTSPAELTSPIAESGAHPVVSPARSNGAGAAVAASLSTGSNGAGAPAGASPATRPGGVRPHDESGRESGDSPGSGSPGAGPAAPSAGDELAGHDELAGRVLSSLDVLVRALRALAGERVEERLVLVGRCESRLAAVKAEAVGELAEWRGEERAAEVLRNDLKQSRGAAKGQVRLAGQLAGVPAVSEALGAGVITPQHARLVAEAAGEAPAGRPIDEAELLAAAEREPADRFGRTVRDHLHERSGDDLAERRRRQRARRRASIKQDPDGMYRLFGTFDPIAGARIETALCAAARRLWHGTDDKDRPTPKQRLADALESLITAGSGGADGAAGAAADVDLLVIADYDILAGRLTDARLGDGTPLAAEELLRLACDAKVLPAIFDQQGEPLWLGRGRRHVTAHQRAALVARDGGCIGCGASPNWCQAHHIRHWEHGGPTDIDNLCLLCSHCHHHLVHINGADIIRGPDGKFTLQLPDRHPPDQHHHQHHHQRRPSRPGRHRRDRHRRNNNPPNGGKPNPSATSPGPPNNNADINNPKRC